MSAHYPPPLRVAIVGTGAIARTHGWRVRDLGSTVVAVCGRTVSSTGALVADIGPTREYTVLDEMLDAVRPDVLHICTPHALHAPQARAALRRGIHVVCEKPLAVTAAEASAVADLADETGLHAAVCLTKRSYPMVAEMRHLITTGAVGGLTAVRGAYLSSDSCHTRHTWSFDAALGGPSYATADLGTHWLDLVEHVGGVRIVTVDARFSTLVARRRRNAREVPVEVEDHARVLLDLEDGTPGSAVFSGVTPGQPNGCELQIDGTMGGLDWRVDAPNHLTHRRVGAPTSTIERDPCALSADARRLCAAPAGHVEGFADAFRNLFRDVYLAISGEPTPYPDFRDGHRAALLVESVVRSARTGHPIDVPGPDAPVAA